MTDKQKLAQGQAGSKGIWTSTGFQPKPTKAPKKPITLIDILLGRK